MLLFSHSCLAYTLVSAHSENVCADQVSCDQISLLQGKSFQSNSLMSDGTIDLMSQSSRRGSLGHLLETTTNLIKSGATPDVVTFVNDTRYEIVYQVQPAIEDEHLVDQQGIDASIQHLHDLVDSFDTADDTTDTSTIVAATSLHHVCRSEEAGKCASFRQCIIELEELWVDVVTQEEIMHDCHTHVHDLWCVAPLPQQPDLSCPDGMGCPFSWDTQMQSPAYTYPSIALLQPIIDFRLTSITHFNCYVTQQPIVVESWRVWREKVEVCSGLDSDLSNQVDVCDGLQEEQDAAWCFQAKTERTARVALGTGWSHKLALHLENVRVTQQLELDRNNEWASLHIISCLLDVIYVSVTRSIEDGIPCITEESNPEQVQLDIDTCHQIHENLTDSCPKADFDCADGKCTCLTIIYPPIPELPEVPPVIEYPCTPAYVALQHFLFSETLADNYPQHGYDTGLNNGWPGCAAPRVCTTCVGMEIPDIDADDFVDSHICHHHEQYLEQGQLDLDSFRCLADDADENPRCVTAAVRCNGHTNCADGSDETGCGTPYSSPPILTHPAACPVTSYQLSLQHLLQCDEKCTSAAGECNGQPNCGTSDIDEASCGCTGYPVAEVKATSGRVATVTSSPAVFTEVFHDRVYRFTDMGDFHHEDYAYVKISNDDKNTDIDHVMLRVTTHEPVTFFVVFESCHHSKLEWLQDGWVASSLGGPLYSGIHETHHKLWAQHNLTDEWVHGPITGEYGPGSVFSRTFAAGTVSMPGNGGGDGSCPEGGDGSYLLFLKKAACAE